ncbi:TIGR03943 family putative permease subunit [Anaerobacillus isosaccharinicus]|uniref:TIGR03943 family protein n=1 Tax=Anaerobacillus isosaccharinicus TaxID=1532552 RepID=A0A1S2L8K0_9BACI|nr:TIGR03943 family protein [Anaerobacillus isosaccharinicus]MBA5585720.1 TIGR03943 family protein [Anaerobacillus isosaccharinicus]QOY35974.1 TIGR03943 family protein [Anaerobacillus isosaccharinicus]
MNNKSDLGFHAYIRGIILFGFALFILGLIITDNMKYYIAPRMMPFIYFSIVVFFLLGIIQIFRSTKKGQTEEGIDCDCGLDHQVSGPRWVKVVVYSIFILPLLMGFIIPDQALNSSIAANRGIIYGSGMNLAKPVDGSSVTPKADQFLNDPEGYLASLEENDDDIEHFQLEDFYDEEWFSEYYEELMADLLNESVIQVTDQNYLDIMTLLDLHLEKFIGKELEITGFVFREQDFEDNRLVVARFSMTCCTADAGVYGTLVESEEADLFENDMWIKVRGTIHKTEYHGYELPIVHLREVTVVAEPDSPYVYPSFR